LKLDFYVAFLRIVTFDFLHMLLQEAPLLAFIKKEESVASSLDKENVWKMINEFYRAAEQPGWKGEINESTAAVFGKMLAEARQCSTALAWIPRPPGGKATITWLCTTLGFAAIRRIREQSSVTCLKLVIYKLGRELDRAAIFGN